MIKKIQGSNKVTNLQIQNTTTVSWHLYIRIYIETFISCDECCMQTGDTHSPQALGLTSEWLIIPGFVTRDFMNCNFPLEFDFVWVTLHTVVVVMGVFGALKPVNCTDWLVVDTLADRSNSVCNRCVMELFSDVFFIALRCFFFKF